MSFRLARTVCAAVALLACVPGTAAAAETGSALNKTEIERIVREYILANPEIITEAIAILQQRKEEEQAMAAAAALAANQDELFNSPTSPVIGNPRGDITLVEFFDYNCGYCKAAHPQRKAAVEDDGKVRVVMKEFPILSASSLEAAKGALAAAKQGKYEEMHETLITWQGPLSAAAVREAAAKVGLDLKRLEKDMESPEILAEIEANRALARQLGINGTPGFVIGETVVPGMIGREAFTALFDAERAARKAAN